MDGTLSPIGIENAALLLIESLKRHQPWSKIHIDIGLPIFEWLQTCSEVNIDSMSTKLIGNLKNQIDNQNQRIKYFEKTLFEKLQYINNLEDKLKREMQMRSNIEAQKLELLALFKEVELNNRLKDFIVQNSNEKIEDIDSLKDSNNSSLNNNEIDDNKVEQFFDQDVSNWTTDTLCEWMRSLNFNDEHISKAKFLNISGKDLVKMSLTDIEKEFSIKNIFHKKKIFFSVETLRTNDTYLKSASKLDCNWVLRWLDDIGLPQYKEAFSINLIDGCLIHLLTYDDLALLGITSALHLSSLQTSIHVLRENHFDPFIFKRRSLPNDPKYPNSKEITLWTTHRVMNWLTSIDLSEYASNLRGAGVHGALIVKEPRFNDNLLASLLTIPNDKTLLRRHLSTHFKQLLGPDIIASKRESELNSIPLAPSTKIKICKKSQFTLKRKKRQHDDLDNLICPLNLRNNE